MNKILLLFILISWSNYLYSQEVSLEIVSTAGETFQGNSMQIDWTLGELAITTLQNSDHQITQGFHQPNYIATIVDELPEEIGQVNVFPNPTSDWLEITFSLNQTNEIQTLLYDIHGRLILKKENKGQIISEHISLKELPNGNYFLTILIDKDQYSKTYKIQKFD